MNSMISELSPTYAIIEKDQHMTTRLRADVFVTTMLPVVPTQPVPEGVTPLWQPTTATLISGANEAILIDATCTFQQAEELANWIAGIGKRLTTIYVTHGHGDHSFGIPTLLRRFPDARAFATAQTIDHLSSQISDPLWDQLFPGQISRPQTLPEES